MEDLSSVLQAVRTRLTSHDGRFRARVLGEKHSVDAAAAADRTGRIGGRTAVSDALSSMIAQAAAMSAR